MGGLEKQPVFTLYSGYPARFNLGHIYTANWLQLRALLFT